MLYRACRWMRALPDVLRALGVNEGTPVNILNKKGSGSVIIKVRGTRLALGKRLSEGITVREEQAS